MKQHKIEYEQVLLKYPDRYIEIYLRIIDETYPDYQNVPVSRAPAVRIWPDKNTYENGDKKDVIAVYWLNEEF
jgi:hypothetical protein